MPSAYDDPDALALLLVQQYLSEQGHSAALAALEASSGTAFDCDKPRRGSALMELVYQHFEQQLASHQPADNEDHSLDQAPNTAAAAHGATSSSTIASQQHAKLQEELMLRSAAADYPSCVTHRVGPLPANLLAVLLWPHEDLVAAAAADGTIRLLRLGGAGAGQQSQQQQQQQGGEEGPAAAGGGESGSGSKQEVWVTRLAGVGGVLTLSWHPAVQAGKHRFAAAQHSPHCLLLAGCMDGSVHVLHAATGQVLAAAKPHSKYVVSAVWAPVLLQPAGDQHQHQEQQQTGEQLIATASYDSSCCLLRLVTSSSDSDPQLSLEVVQQVPLDGYVQDVCFLPPGSAGAAPDQCPDRDSSTGTPAAGAGAGRGLQLVVASRGINCLTVLNVQLLRYAHAGADAGSSTSSTATPVWSVTAARLVNMSEAGDSHVSFSAMRIAASPCSRYLLIATDSPILLVLRLSDWGVVRRLYALDPPDKFHNASVAWHRSSSYFFAAAPHATVSVNHVGTAKCVAQLSKGHTVNVRAITYDAATNRLASCSFDKTLCVYCEEP